VFPLTLLAAAAVSLVSTAPAFANEPFWTQRPDLTIQGSRLYASNGGWTSYSGPVSKNLYRFLRDGLVVKGLNGAVPKTTPPDLSLPGVTPDDPNAPYYNLSASDVGHCFTAEVWGGTRSTYYTVDGTLVYDVWEWGHLDSFEQPAVTNQVCVGDVPTPQVEQASLALGPQTLRGARANTPWSEQLVAFGGSGSYTFGLLAGSLPRGMTLRPDGLLSGAPDAPAGSYPFTFAVRDSAGRTASLEVVFTVLPPRVAFVTSALPVAKVNVRYRATIEVSGGSSVRSFSVVAGQPPPGIVLDRSGVLRGRPTRAGVFGFTVQARDRNGVTRRHYYGVRVR
jgi:Putative Ig domain